MINRRDFLKTGSITGLGMLSAGWRGLNHDHPVGRDRGEQVFNMRGYAAPALDQVRVAVFGIGSRSEEHTSELQSRGHLVCRLLLEKKKKNIKQNITERQV